MTTSNWPFGLTNAEITTTLGSYVAPDPTGVFQFFDDFTKFDGAASGAHDWLTTNASSGTAVVTDEKFGVLTVTNGSATDNIFVSSQWKGFDATSDVAEIFKVDLTKDFWFKTRFKLSDATQSDGLVGLLTTNVDPITAVVDGIYFLKPDDAGTLQLKLTKNSTSTTFTVGTMADDTYVTCGFHYNPNAQTPWVSVYLNDVVVGHVTTLTNFIDDEEITPTFTIQNGAAAVKAMSIDYIFAAQPRP